MVFPFSARPVFSRLRLAGPQGSVQDACLLCSKGTPSMEVKTLPARPRRQEEAQDKQFRDGGGVRVEQKVLRAQKEHRERV